MKRLMVKVGTYQKDGKEKGEYVKVGVILENANGEYALLDPTISMAGVAYKQMTNGIAKQGSDSVIASIFTDEPQAAPAQGMDDGFNDDFPI